MAADWIRQRAGLYHSADGKRRLVFTEDVSMWWSMPNDGKRGHTFSQMQGPYQLASMAGTLDAPPGLGDLTFEAAEK